MNVLAGYGSGDSDAENAASPPTKSPAYAEAKNPTDKPRDVGGKKVKKLDISFLPPEIQAALARGDNMSDSDSEGEGGAAKATNNSSSVPSTGRGAPVDRTRSMLDSLPKPMRDRDAAAVVHSTHRPLTTPSFVTADASQDRNDPRSRIIGSVNSVNGSSRGVGSNRHDGFVFPVRANVCTAPPTQAAVLGPEIGPVMDTSMYSGGYPTHSSSNSAPSQGDRVSSRPQQQSLSAPAMMNDGSGKKSRKRDREIQLELMNGNVGAVEQSQFVDVSTKGRGWDSSTYQEQKKREAEVASMFGQKAGANMISQPTKQQSRKHQINALAMSAASAELELMEARGARAKSKSETQAKYGW